MNKQQLNYKIGIKHLETIKDDSVKHLFKEILEEYKSMSLEIESLKKDAKRDINTRNKIINSLGYEHDRVYGGLKRKLDD